MSAQLSISPNERIPIEILFEDEHFIALNKPSGIVTQPGDKHWHDSLLNGAFSRWGTILQNLGKKRDFGLLHRLDKGTSGVVLIALSIDAYSELRAQFENRTIQKTYLTLANGYLTPPEGRCELRILEHQREGKKRAQVIHPHQLPPSPVSHRKERQGQSRAGGKVAVKGQKAVTQYHTLDHVHTAHGIVSLLQCKPHTGRLHQIRAHLSALNAPVLGDFEYGGRREFNLRVRDLQREMLLLHAAQLEITHPIRGDRIKIIAPLPERFLQLLSELNLTLPPQL